MKMHKKIILFAVLIFLAACFTMPAEEVLLPPTVVMEFDTETYTVIPIARGTFLQRISNLQSDNSYTNQQAERELSILRLRHYALLNRIASYEAPESILLEQAEHYQLRINRHIVSMEHTREWQQFHLSYEQAILGRLLNQAVM